MKKIKFIITFMSVINILAIAGLLGWLGATGRIDQRRLMEIRELFTEPTIDRDTREQDAAAEAERVAAEIAATALPDSPPIGAQDVLLLRREASALEDRKISRLRRETEDLRATLRQREQTIEREQQKLAEDRAAFEQMRAEILDLEGDAQFRKTVAVYDGLKADEAKKIMTEMLGQGQLSQVVGYINAMGDRQRIKLIGEFLGDDEAPLAAQLLEELRNRGLGVPDPEEIGA